MSAVFQAAPSNVSQFISSYSIDGSYVKKSAERCARKNIGAILSSAGSDGQSGSGGSSGSSGHFGSSGRPHGQRGGNGSDGGHGHNGTPGQSAGDIFLQIAGQHAGDVQVMGSHTGSLVLPGDSVCKVFSKGGNGGHGGCGGDGGSGGPGGAGYDGRSGDRGRDGSFPGSDGGPGGDGEDGGNGGNGGDGGDGGDGGNGASGGDGGHVVLQTVNPALLMLFEVDARRGAGGRAGPGGSRGHGGSGGRAGSGGSGGSGGSPGPRTEGGSMGTSGRSGRSGSQGSSGHSGNSGRDGRDGNSARDGRDGMIVYIVVDGSGQVREQGLSRYDIAVVDYTVKTEIDDTIFEPGETIVISQVTLRNLGSISSPANVEIRFPPNPSFLHDNSQVFLLPPLAPGDSFVIPEAFRGQIPDDPGRTAVGKYETETTVVSHASILGRGFEEMVKKVKKVQYPVQVTNVVSSNQMAKGDHAVVSFEITNISTFDYGNSIEGGSISVKVLLQDVGIILSSNPEQRCIEYEIDLLSPFASGKGNFHAEFEIEVLDSFLVKFFHRMPWHIQLFFRGKLIEVAEALIRVTPNFFAMTPEVAPNIDGLFVTDKHLVEIEFDLYMRIFEGIGLTMNVWDVERYRGFSADVMTGVRHQVTWANTFKDKVILAPLAAPNNFFFQVMHPADLLYHFVSPTQHPLQFTEHDSGMLVLNAPQPSVPFRSNLFACACKQAVPEKGLKVWFNPFKGDDHSGKKFSLKRKMKRWGIRKMMERPSSIIQVTDLVPNFEQQGFVRATLGTASWQELPLRRHTRLVFAMAPPVGTVQSNVLARDTVDLRESTTIPKGTNFYYVFRSLIVALPLAKKMSLFFSQGRANTENWQFVTPHRGPGGAPIAHGFAGVIGEALFIEFKTDCMYKDLEFGRVARVLQVIQGNPTAYAGSDQIIAAILLACYRTQRFLRLWTLYFNRRRKRLQAIVTQIENALFRAVAGRRVDRGGMIRRLKASCADQEQLPLGGVLYAFSAM